MAALLPQELAARIKLKAANIGFDACRITSASLAPQTGERLDEFLKLNRHGEMAWMEPRANWRSSPDVLWPEARSVIMLALNYGPDTDPMEGLAHKETGVISVYARNRDYHDLVKKRLKRLGRWLIDEAGGEIKVFVDTAPVMEKPLAHAAGLGWQGKHTNLVSRDFGAWLFLGAIFTTHPLVEDEAETDHCGTCRKCLDICPTNAFPAPYQLDARACISYLTIEHKGPIPYAYRRAMGNRIYGCDDCLAACPWNKFAETSNEAAFHAREALDAPDLGDLASLDDASFRALFSGSPIKRIKRAAFVRNCLIAIGNSGAKRFIPLVTQLISDMEPVVRGAAIWALGELAPGDAVLLRETHINSEQDETVRDEWIAITVNA